MKGAVLQYIAVAKRSSSLNDAADVQYLGRYSRENARLRTLHVRSSCNYLPTTYVQYSTSPFPNPTQHNKRPKGQHQKQEAYTPKAQTTYRRAFLAVLLFALCSSYSRMSNQSSRDNFVTDISSVERRKDKPASCVSDFLAPCLFSSRFFGWMWVGQVRAFM